MRLLVLSAFFNFSGIHQGYSAVQLASPSPARSIQSVAVRLQGLVIVRASFEIPSALRAAQRVVVQTTLGAADAVTRFFRSGPGLPALFAQQSPRYDSAGALSRSDFRQEAWIKLSNLPSGERRELPWLPAQALKLVRAAHGPSLSARHEGAAPGFTASRPRARSDCGDSAFSIFAAPITQ